MKIGRGLLSVGRRMSCAVFRDQVRVYVKTDIEQDGDPEAVKQMVVLTWICMHGSRRLTWWVKQRKYSRSPVEVCR